MSDLVIGRVWITECQRCANEGVSYEETAEEARGDLAAMGWDDGFCPSCNETREP